MFTPSEIKYIKQSDIYKVFGRQQISAITVADLVTAIKKIRLIEPNNMVLLQYGDMLLEMVQKDVDGRITVYEKNSGLMGDYTKAAMYGIQSPGVAVPSGTLTAVLKRMHVLAYVDFTSNAGGTLDADVELIPALASYYGVGKLKKIWCDNILAAGGSLVIEATTEGALRTVGLKAFVANEPNDTAEGIHIWPLAKTDNKSVYIDVTSADLGNTFTYHLEYEYWYET